MSGGSLVLHVLEEKTNSVSDEQINEQDIWTEFQAWQLQLTWLRNTFVGELNQIRGFPYYYEFRALTSMQEWNLFSLFLRFLSDKRKKFLYFNAWITTAKLGPPLICYFFGGLFSSNFMTAIPYFPGCKAKIEAYLFLPSESFRNFPPP